MQRLLPAELKCSGVCSAWTCLVLSSLQVVGATVAVTRAGPVGRLNFLDERVVGGRRWASQGHWRPWTGESARFVQEVTIGFGFRRARSSRPLGVPLVGIDSASGSRHEMT